jgi:hypothetical protein
LKPGGLLFLSTPDAGSLVARMLNQHWHYFDPIQHLVYFNRDNLKKLLEIAGFDLLQFCSFGHYYKIIYILDRLAYLHQGKIIHAFFNGCKRGLRPFWNKNLYLNLGDVMGVVSQKRTKPVSK